MKHSITGKVIAITGAARGIGAAIARDLHRSGARVAIGDLNVDAAAELAAELGVNAFAHRLDVTDPVSFQAFFDATVQALGPVDVLVNNAGVMWVGPFEEEPFEILQRQFAVNVIGVINGFKIAAPAMRQRKQGQIVTIASAASKLVLRGETAYAATKHAVYGFCTGARAELHRSGVAVSVVMPAVVDTELAAGTSEGLIKRLTPEDVARAVHHVIETRRLEIYVPAPLGLLTRLLAVAPARVSAAMMRWFMPNQLVKGDPARRRDYEGSL